MAVAVAKSTFQGVGGRSIRSFQSCGKGTFGPRSSRGFPIPREQNEYAEAKRFEYEKKDLDSAAECYLRCIEKGCRAESALKDLASLWHQRGWTEKACELLRSNKHLIKEDMASYQNLLSNLEDKVQNRTPRYLLLQDLPKDCTEGDIRQLFTHPQRIMDIEILPGEGGLVKARLRCMSISAAKKTMGCFTKRKEMSIGIEELCDTDTSETEAEATPRQLTESCESLSLEHLLGVELLKALDPVFDF